MRTTELNARTADERIRIEQRPSDVVHGRSYPNGPTETAPCRYCGHPTVEDLSFSALAKRRLGTCQTCRSLLRGQAEPLEGDFWPTRRSSRRQSKKGHDE